MYKFTFHYCSLTIILDIAMCQEKSCCKSMMFCNIFWQLADISVQMISLSITLCFYTLSTMSAPSSSFALKSNFWTITLYLHPCTCMDLAVWGQCMSLRYRISGSCEWVPFKVTRGLVMDQLTEAARKMFHGLSWWWHKYSYHIKWWHNG